MNENLRRRIDIIEKYRKEMHVMVDERCDQYITELKAGTFIPPREQVLPLSYMPAYFKGKKPLSVVFADGREVDAQTWKKVVTIIMQDCNATKQGYKNLRKISGKVSGKQRLLLSNSPEGMNVPLKIDEDLYLEGKFDTESLIRVMNSLIFDAVGYEYGGIHIKIRNPVSDVEESVDLELNDMDVTQEEESEITIQM